MIRRAVFLCVLACMLPSWGVAGCRSSRVDELCANLAEELITTLQVRMDRSAPIMVTTFADLHHLEQTSPLGRLLEEALGAQFFQHGFRIIESRLRTSTVGAPGESGTFVLSRDTRHIDASRSVRAFLTGTYAVSDRGILVSARLVDALDSSLLATAQCQLRLSPETEALLTMPPAQPPTPDRLMHPLQKTDARIIQQKLQDLGLYKGKIDGVWGKKSALALQRFKSNAGLSATATWDHATQVALFSPPAQN